MIEYESPMSSTPAGRAWQQEVAARRREIGDRLVVLGYFGPSKVRLTFGRSPLHGFGIFAGQPIRADTEIVSPVLPGKNPPLAECDAMARVDASFNTGVYPDVRASARGAVAVGLGLSFETPRGNVRNLEYVDRRKHRSVAMRKLADRDIEEGEELLGIVPVVVVEVSSLKLDGRWFVDVEAPRFAWTQFPED